MKIKYALIYAMICISNFFLVNCGVKGKPLPPLNGVEAGYGKHPLSQSQEFRKKVEKKDKVLKVPQSDDWEAEGNKDNF
jgi:hypothetical protein